MDSSTESSSETELSVLDDSATESEGEITGTLKWANFRIFDRQASRLDHVSACFMTANMVTVSSTSATSIRTLLGTSWTVSRCVAANHALLWDADEGQ